MSSLSWCRRSCSPTPPRVIRARSRLRAFAFWDIATFLINGALWVFVGVQIPSAVRGISRVDGGVRHAVFWLWPSPVSSS